MADSPFAAAPITRLSELRLGALEDRVEAELALGRGAGLVPELQELAAAHPLRERLRGQLMRALQAAGRQADALAAYEDTRRVLADQLGVDPSADLAAVHLAILRGEQPPPAGPGNGQGPTGAGGALPRTGTRSRAGLSGPAQPSSLVPDRSNLPAQLTSFVGREEEMGRLGKLLGESRLVTLTGPGGAGKTRLSVEASGRLAGELADGVWFVPLAPVRDALDVPQAVLTAIGVQDAGWLDPAEAARLAALAPADRLADVLARRELLLVLDNCEHLVGRGGPAGGPGAEPGAGGADPGHQPGAAGHHRGDAVPGAVAGAAAGGVRRGGGGAVRGGGAVHRPGLGGAAGLHRGPRHGRPGGPDLPGSGRHPAGHRAGRGPAASADRGPGGRPAG